MSKSIPDDYVAVATKQCPVCGKVHSHNTEVLISKNLKSIGENTFTGIGLCEEHSKYFEDGYIALIGMDESKSTFLPNGNVDPKGAHRTGKAAYLRREVANKVFDTDIGSDLPMVFVEDQVVDMLAEMQETIH